MVILTCVWGNGSGWVRLNVLKDVAARGASSSMWVLISFSIPRVLLPLRVQPSYLLCDFFDVVLVNPHAIVAWKY